MCMGIEILYGSGQLAPHKTMFEGTLSSCSFTQYLSAEYFRLKSLCWLDSPLLAPSGLSEIFAPCEVHDGYCDFPVAGKVDDYMGSAKRTSLDKMIASPVAGLHALYLASFVGEQKKLQVAERLKRYGRYIRSNPFGIQPFKMRDIDAPFGTGISPLEVIAASYLVNLSEYSHTSAA
jgi:hypothetical protein